ncbi:MAG: cell division protein [Herminiimonas sp.]|nr:cell division protein [Herminiimonas sp.]
MTDLQTSLMAVGGIIVVAVVSYNKWQEYKEKKSVDRAFSDTPETLAATGAVDHTRAEPTFGLPPTEAESDAASMPDAVAVSAFSVDPASPDAPRAGTNADGRQPATPAEMPKRDLPVDALVDCVIPLALGSNLRGEKIIGPIQSLRHVGNKPVNFVGQREDGNWEAIQHGVVYSALLCGIQLANRSSALNEIEFSELVMRLRQVADELDAEPDVPNMTSVMQSARALHQFVGLYDAQLGVNLKANGAAWSIATLLSALERQGFDVRPDGRLVMSDGEGGNLFSMSTNVTLAVESTTRLTLLLDVPCVAPDRDGFGAMIACARSLSHRLDGQVVDDTDQPLSDAGLAEIGGQVQTFYHDMQAADIPAGSIRALRLFS